MASTTLLEGHLNKQSEKSVINFFRKRYFRLDSTRIRYFRDKDGEELGQLNLTDIVRVEENYRTNPRDLTGFSIISKDRRWVLNAESAADREMWVKAILGAIASAKGEKSRTTEKVKVNKIQRPATQVNELELSSSQFVPATGIFDFEEELEKPNSVEKFLPDTTEDEVELEVDEEPSAPLGRQDSSNSRATRILGTSVPVAIPQRLAHTWHERFIYSDSDDEGGLEFEKPHELAAKTYREQYLLTGDFQFDVPVSASHKVKALI